MKKWAGALAMLAWLCAPLWAQEQDKSCSDAPPAHQIDREGNVSPEFREWDPGRCSRWTLERSSSAGVISARALAHKPLKGAGKEFERGVQARRKGQSDEALRHFAEAVRLDPNFAEAQIDLGAVYVERGQAALALPYFDRALALEPSSAVPYTARATALVTLHRFGEGEEAARRALLLDPESIEAHYMLCVALIMQDKVTPEAAVHLSAAAGRYPRARTFLDDVPPYLVKNQGH